MLIGLLALTLTAGCTSMTGKPVVGSSTGDTPPGTASASSSVDPAGDPNSTDGAVDAAAASPTSTQLIAAALARGTIDEPTSLLYRTWVYFGDPHLPEEYIGTAAPYELGLLAEVRDKLDGMPAKIRAQIEPYLLRPANTASAFNAAVGESDPPGLRGASVTAIQAGGGAGAQHKCRTGWDSAAVEGIHFRVWACRDADALPGMSTDDAIATVATMLRKYVPEMTADMGAVIPDDPNQQTMLPRDEWAGAGIDDRIDVYVLPTGWKGPYRANASQSPNYARAVQAPPITSATASSYVLVSPNHLDDMLLLERVVVHELFHVLQRTHHAHLDAQWWVEGSAEWAASYYVRSDSARLHEARLPVRQNSTGSLLRTRAEENLSPYGAYLWPLFMEQEAGAGSVFAVWQDLAEYPAGTGNSAVIGVINEQVDLPGNFAEFTMRTLNANLAGDPISPRFVDVDGNFPDGLLPQMPTVELTKVPLEIGELRVEGLGHYFIDVEVPGLAPDPPDADVSVTITSDIAQYVSTMPRLEALVRTQDGTYERQSINYGGDGTTVCVSKNLKLVLSNSATTALDAATGSVYLERNFDEDGKPMPCTRIEATDPETLVRLTDGDILAVDGTENDEKPGVAPVRMTVRDVPSKDIGDFRVAVTLSGGTLTADKEFDWPLSEFDVLAPGKVYRKSIDVPLDRDLTDRNRDFTIDARLIRKTDEVHADRPTVELHGLTPCDPSAVDVTCELVGDLQFSFDGDYQSKTGGGTSRSAHLDGTLSLRLGEFQKGMLGSYDGYPDAGSTLDVSGSAVFRHDTSGSSVQGTTTMSQTFATQADESANMPAIGVRNGFQAHIMMIGDQPTLGIMVPIATTITTTNVDMADPHAADPLSWPIGCPTVPTKDFEQNTQFWTDVNADRDVFSLPQTFDDDFGAWNDDGTQFTVSCSRTWGPGTWLDGATGSMTYRLNGTLRWVTVDE